MQKNQRNHKKPKKKRDSKKLWRESTQRKARAYRNTKKKTSQIQKVFAYAVIVSIILLLAALLTLYI